MWFFLLSLLVLILPVTSLGLSPISIKGSKFFANGHQFFLKGVAYQPTPSDPLTNATQCSLDAQLMSSIAVNSIRVYHVNPRMNHDECMQIFETAGIYLWLDLSTYNNAIPQTNPHWTNGQFLQYIDIVKTFHKYDNLAGFWIGNQVISTKEGSLAAPFLKAAAADIRTYMQVSGHRRIPIGYSAADIAELRPMLQNYLVCGNRRDQAIDFFGMNNFQWCGLATYAGYSGYQLLQEQAKDYPAPIFFSETGCINPRPRKFQDQTAIFGNKMSGTWSGSIVYEWAQKINKYGLVEYPDKKTNIGIPKPIKKEFENLANVWALTDPSLAVREAQYTPNLIIPPCPTPTKFWMINGDQPLPTLNQYFVQDVAYKGDQYRRSLVPEVENPEKSSGARLYASDEVISDSATTPTSGAIRRAARLEPATILPISGYNTSRLEVSFVAPPTGTVPLSTNISNKTAPQEMTVMPFTTTILNISKSQTSSLTKAQEMTVDPITTNILASSSTASTTADSSVTSQTVPISSQFPTTSSGLFPSSTTTSGNPPSVVVSSSGNSFGDERYWSMFSTFLGFNLFVAWVVHFWQN